MLEERKILQREGLTKLAEDKNWPSQFSEMSYLVSEMGPLIGFRWFYIFNMKHIFKSCIPISNKNVIAGSYFQTVGTESTCQKVTHVCFKQWNAKMRVVPCFITC